MTENIFNFMRTNSISNINEARKIFRKIIKFACKKYNEEEIYAIIIDINNIISIINDDYIDKALKDNPEKIFDIYDMTLNVILVLINLYEIVKNYNYNKRVSYDEYIEFINNNTM